MRTIPIRHAWLAILALLAMDLGGCTAHHQRMVDRTEWFLQAQQHREALDYLERYLGQHPGNAEAWRYRVRIRLDLDQRAAAGAEYWRMQTALGQPEPELLGHVVLANGGQWTTDDFGPLARCGPDGIGDLALFEQQLLGRQSAPGSDIYLAPRQETVIGVMDALPGRFGAGIVPLLRDGFSQPAPETRLAAAAATIRLLPTSPELARPLVQAALTDPSRTVRRGTLEALLTSAGAGDLTIYEPMAGEADPAVAVGWLALAERVGGTRADELTATMAAAVPLAAAWRRPPPVAAGEEEDSAEEASQQGPPPGGDPQVALVWSLRHGDTTASRPMAKAPFEVRRSLALLVAPVLLESELLALLVDDPDVVVRTAMAEYLVRGTAAEPALVLLSDEQPGIRLAAARALTRSGDPAALEPLTAYFAAGWLEERLAVLESMRTLVPNPFDALARRALADELPLVREAAVALVAGSCADDLAPTLFAALTDDDPHVVVRAAAA
ncbi:MAG: HEAT repeat domain-containing protein, partial [Myxococcota bacterium]|nr:HEAT repeat domain-containing protein [Myxococcota bacterium]